MTMEHTSSGIIRSGIWKNAFLWSVLLTAFLLLLITAASRRSETPSFEPGGRILIADFREETGASLFAAGLRPILNLALDQSRQFRVYPESELRESLRWLAADPQSPATAGLALQVCSRERIPVFLLPRLSRADGFFVLSASLYEVRNNRIFREVLVDSVRAGSEPELLYAVEHLAIKVRRQFGEKDPSPAMIGSLFPPRPALPAQSLQLFVHANFLASPKGLQRRTVAAGADCRICPYFRPCPDAARVPVHEGWKVWRGS